MNKIQNKINRTVGTIPKGNIRIIKRGKTISLTHNLHMTVDGEVWYRHTNKNIIMTIRFVFL
jgi:hypothetical protein